MSVWGPVRVISQRNSDMFIDFNTTPKGEWQRGQMFQFLQDEIFIFLILWLICTLMSAHF